MELREGPQKSLERRTREAVSKVPRVSVKFLWKFLDSGENGRRVKGLGRTRGIRLNADEL